VAVTGEERVHERKKFRPAVESRQRFTCRWHAGAQPRRDRRPAGGVRRKLVHPQRHVEQIRAEALDEPQRLAHRPARDGRLVRVGEVLDDLVRAEDREEVDLPRP
jgi:hypothetical protein